MSMHFDASARWQGSFSDGRAPVSTPVSVSLGTDGLIFEGDGWPKPRVWSYRQLAANAPLKSRATDMLLRSTAHDGQTLYLQGPGIAAGLLAKAPELSAARQRLRWMRPGLAVVASVAVIAAGIAFSGYSPAQGIAKRLPEGARDAMGQSVVASLAGKHRVCETTASRGALQRLTARLAKGAQKDPLKVKVRIVDWGLVNAFAVPGGHIILTRGLLHTAGSPDEVAGVLAHELGHALELHPETGLVRSAGLGAAVQLMFAGSAGTMTNIGLLITEIQYTRVAEHEADAHAVRILRNAGISAKGFADFFKRIDSPAERSVFNSAVVRTHPLTAERIAFVNSQPSYPATPALNADDWQALRSACGAPPANPRQEHERTVADATRALETRPDDVTQLQRRARALTRLDKHTEALADWDRVVRLRPKDAEAHVGRGASLDALTRHEDAITAYDEALRLVPNHAIARNRHALSNRALKRYDEALKDFDILLEVSPKFAAGYYNRGLVLMDLKRPDDALRAFDGAINLDKDYAAAYTHRGIIHMDGGRKDAAIAEFRLALAAQGKQESAAWAQREARNGLRKLGVPEKP